MSVFKIIVHWFVITIVAMFTIVATTHNCCKKTTIVSTPTTIVSILINCNCCNTKHKCRKFSEKNMGFLICALRKIMTFHTIWSTPRIASHNLTMKIVKYTVAHHKTILQLSQFRYWNCDNCETFKIIAVSYEKIATFATTRFLKNEWWWIYLWPVE